MKNIEKALTNYIEGKGPKVGASILCECALENADKTIDILFKVINKELDGNLDIKSLESVRELLKCISIILLNTSTLNRKNINRKIRNLYEKIDRLKIENRNKYRDINIAYRELELTRNELLEVQEQTEGKETKQYDFITYLINKIRNITYLECAFKGMPNLVNAKDKEDSSLLKNIILQYIASMKDDDAEDILYYNNIISLFFSTKALTISDQEKRKLLETINCTIDQLSINKKLQKRNRKKIELLNILAETIKGHNEKSVKIEPIASKYGVSINFNETILTQAKLVKEAKEGVMTDREAIDDYIITIDNDNAVEIDDALSCRKLPNGNYLLGVHIASILGYFPYESDIVQEAIKRTKSIYLSNDYQNKEDDYNRVIPIFPYEFSAEKASLLPNEKKLARSYYFEINELGDVVNEKFIKSIITSSKKATYREIDEVSLKGSEDKKLEELVGNLQKITEILDKKYKGTDMYEQVKESREDCSDLAVKKIGSEKIVYQAMILTGNRVAEYFAKRFYPCLYRVHEVNETDTIKLEAMINNLTETYGGDQYKKLYQLIQGLYPRGWYASSGKHSGLKLEHYCHCTSGLRRGADIVVEHALEVCYDKEPTEEEVEKLKKDVEEKLDIINSREEPIEWFVKEFQRVYRRR